jgi:FkbM family methyltransferase
MMKLLKKHIENMGPLRRAWRKFRPLPIGNDAFLLQCHSIVHVGANVGQERFHYESLGLEVFWVEPIPGIFDELIRNIRGFQGQKAIQALVSDRDGERVEFLISNNSGLSSSMFNLARHKTVWPEVDLIDKIKMETKTLDSLIDADVKIDAIVLDTQGSELLVLRGARRLLKDATYVKTEAADFSLYDGGCELDELIKFFDEIGYTEVMRIEFSSTEDVGRCFDVIFKNNTKSLSIV